MADGGYGPDFLSRSMFFREAEAGPSQQELATMTAPFGGSVEQARALYQSPEVQQRLQHFGLGGFNPDMIRQSPFLPNQFMQAHPGLGHMLSGAMANAAATPEAPLVSGAGSGISRAMQGMYGGPELQRQYQVRQLMAPFQAMGMQLPIMAEQRRQELLQALEKDMQQRQQMEAGQIRPTEPKVTSLPGYGYATTQYEQGAPAGGPSGLEMVQTGQRPPVSMLSPGMQGQQAPVPGYGLTPEQQTGWTVTPHALDAAQYGAVSGAKGAGELAAHPERQSLADWRKALIEAGVPDNQADKLLADAEKARAQAGLADRSPGKGAGGAATKDYSKDYASVGEKYQTQIQALERMLAAGMDPQNNKLNDDQRAMLKNQIDQLNQSWQDEIDTIDKQRGDPGASRREREKTGKTFPKPLITPPQVSPGASPAGAQAGGAGSQTSQGTAIAPQQFPADSQVDEAGNVFDSKGNFLGRQQASPAPAPAPTPRQ